ncbi:MAG TPA: YbhB/YbcL family Raf kinase inhibitor-like protein [Patescibacteria group bacterium]|nr:YbhB/YbcL family Raf kinase inhibitor-like protein [Patescibacteria group bacterium]
MELTSPAFSANQLIPVNHTHQGAGISPPLMVSGAPEGTESLALIVHDPDAPSGDFTHWLIWNISGSTGVLPEDHIPTGAVQGTNDFGAVGYGAPAPPTGTHHYVFNVYALNCELPLKAGAHLGDLQQAMEGHILAQADLVGVVTA